MEIEVSDPVTQTNYFAFVFLSALIFSIRHKKTILSFTKEMTEDLKGFGILAVMFSHIGYFLVSGDKFLFPLSILAGVGVNLFLFLSGFGITLSELSKPVNILEFYKKRLPKLFVPMWITITAFILLDFAFLQKTYPIQTLLQNYLGFFPRADIFLDLDSPLWYFSLIFFYYLTFPLFYWRKFPLLCAPLLLLAGYFTLHMPLPVNESVLDLYKLHFMSFPLGVYFALLIKQENLHPVKTIIKEAFVKYNLKYFFAPVFIVIFFYTSFNSGVDLGKLIEQTYSLITMFSVIFLFFISSYRFSLFGLSGKYSYQIYLIHWPVLSRYGFLYFYSPAFLATSLYLGIFVGLGSLMQRIIKLRRP